MANTRYCEKCRNVKPEKDFYRSNNLEKYPDGGYLNVCKDCLTRHVDNFEPSTYTPILEMADVPYVPDEWNKLLQNYGNQPEKLNGTSILGRYLAKMRLKQWKDYRWKDTDFLRELAEKRVKESMEHQGYDSSEIARTIATQDYITKPPEKPPAPVQEQVIAPWDQPLSEEEKGDLTDEDIQYLRIKWGKTYRPDEWIQLETLYNDMMNSYDIQTAGHKDNLKLVCKASLKANQMLDLGDIDGAQKATRMYDTLMKQGNFTAAQNKTEKANFVDSIGELVKICETQGFIPRYYTTEPKDQVDKVILDMQHYNRQLVVEELGLGNLIENAVRNIQREQETIAAAAQLDEEAEEKAEADALFDYDAHDDMNDEDIEEYSDYLTLQEQKDEEYFKKIGGR